MKKRDSFARASRLVVLSGLVLSAGLVLPMLEGCKKKEIAKAPPPPPPPPPPKEPDPIDLKALAQTLKASKKVAFADGASTNKEALAKAIIDLADSIARGDDKKFASMISAEDKSLLKTLTASGEWKDETSKIEGVRVLNIREGGDVAMSASSSGADFGPDMSLVSLIKMQLKMLPPAAKDELTKELGHEPTEADMDKLIEMSRNQLATLKGGGTLPGFENLPAEMKDKVTEQLEKMIEAYDASVAAKKPATPEPTPAPSGDSDTKFTVVFAVQEPGSAFVQGWVAVPLGEKWVFKASSGQLPAARTRATEFDSMFGGGGDAAPADKPADKTDDKPKDETPAPIPGGPKGKGGGNRSTGG